MLFPHRSGNTAAIVLSMGVAALAQTSHAQEVRKPFNIAAGPAASAVTEFARQAQINVLASGETLAGIDTPAVRGTYSVTEALALLLSGTNLISKVNTSGAVFIMLPA
ncbi:MAG: STN domain-containing protein, partial [Massilia sp.]